jgi:hypothetical protein
MIKNNKTYTLNQETAVLWLDQGLHLDERHIIINNEKLLVV